MNQARKAAAVLLVLGAFLAMPPVFGDQDKTIDMMIRIDVDSATETFCTVGPTISGPGVLATSGSSTTVTCAACLGDIDADDIILVDRQLTTGAVDTRRVAGNPASASSMTIDEAVTWTGGFAWRYRKQACGTTANDGWTKEVSGRTVKRFEMALEQGDIDGLDWEIQCRGAGSGALGQAVWPGTATVCGPLGGSTVTSGFCRFANATKGTTAGRYSVRDDLPWQACRIGFKYQSTDASDAGANLEIVNASVTVSDQGK